MVELTVLILETISIILFLAATGLILLMILTRFKGMRKPPFWLYMFGGFLIITFHGVLTVFAVSYSSSMLPAYVIPLIRLLGNILVFIGIYKVYKAHSSSIKFDKESNNLPSNALSDTSST